MLTASHVPNEPLAGFPMLAAAGCVTDATLASLHASIDADWLCVLMPMLMQTS